MIRRIRMASARGWLVRAWLMIALSVVGTAHAEPGRKDNPFAGKTVLVLNSYADGYGAQNRIEAGFLAGVTEAGGRTEDLHFEKLDLLRHPSADYRQHLIDFLRNKYEDRKPDLVITTQRPAFDFARNEGQALFDGVPLIAALVHRQDVAPALRDNEVLLPYEVDFAGTLKHALALHPNTRRVVMIGGVHPTDRLFVTQAQQAFAPWQERLALEWLTDGDWEATLTRASSLPPDSIIVMGTYYRDRDGNNFPTREKLLMVGQQANAPIFSQWDSQLDSDVVVGGAMVSVEGLGRQAALAAADFLAGRQTLETLRALPPVRGLPMFNWKLIERWKGQRAALPADTVFIHRPKTLWSDYRSAVIGFGLVITLLAISVVALAVILSQRRRMETKLRAVVNASPIAVAILTPTGIVEYVNARFIAIFGYGLSDFRNRDDWWLLAYPDADYRARVRAEWQRRFNAAKAAAHVTQYESEVRCKDGATKFVEWGAATLKTRVVVFARDMTEQVLAERERQRYHDHLEEAIAERTEKLALALRQAEAATVAKDAFLANMSHEIRTPLNAIIGMTYMALHSRPEKHVQGYLEKIGTSSEFLLELVNEILDYAKIDAGAMQIALRVFCLDDVLRRVADLMEARSRAKGLEFSIVTRGTMPDALIGDPLRLGQVLINLCGNAVKFTDSGQVTLTVELQEATSASIEATFTVTDTGIGIAPEHLDHLFEAFWQLEPSTTRNARGTGLGLPIAQRLVEMMGGEITVRSTLGSGSSFSFALRFEGAAQSAAPEKRTSFDAVPALPHFAGSRVLLVEDNAGNQAFMQDLLSAMGIEVTLASNGAEGVQKALDDRFDLILMDIRMPVMDGLSACRQIRAARGTTTPILAMTAHLDKAAHDQSTATGMNGHLTKPLDMKQFIDALRHWLPEDDRSSTPPPATPHLPVSNAVPTEAVSLAEVLHDLRSPLTSILGYARLLEAEPGKVGRMAGIIRSSADHMLALTNGVLPDSAAPDEAAPSATMPMKSKPAADQLTELRRLLDLGAVSDIAEWASAQASQDGHHRQFFEQVGTLAGMGDLRGLRDLAAGDTARSTSQHPPPDDA